MSMISIAVYDTVENQRTKFTKETLSGLLETVDFNKHRLFIIDNASCKQTHDFYKTFSATFTERFTPSNLTIIYNESNIGTARAINKAWKLRKPGEHCVKMDNDVVIHSKGWLDEMEFAVKKQPEIGIIGLKRKDLEEYPEHPNPDFRSKLIQIPHERGERWVTVEAVGHVIGTCQMYSGRMLDIKKEDNGFGFLYQPGIYGFDDVLAAYRAAAIGFWSVFLPHIEIDHIDPGGDAYTEEKREYVREYVKGVHIRGHEYLDQVRPVWEDA